MGFTGYMVPLLHNPCRLRGYPMLQSGGQNQKWPTKGPSGYIGAAVWGGALCFKVLDKIRNSPEEAKGS